ncbi:Uncharacterised protein [Mycobacteroides abscessus subsp. abscessus]|uniref:DUF4192 domain-containing protein n=1 Tax=Mycobacteroides abscessus TaxID=36809 RepID=UPI000927E22A|nr:DUF4192 domain-containing protein [Mycobacteroides abscessus]MDO3085221.1 DUF4192 domain-containing protein [Mycobacteroides abscessus subsp. abscessus]SHQ99936.1 Uncharacterised protein [Mycobacteroides abscessus subsp. abscessus]SHS01969.1 Uncharacterised protein [Mycobacteroides abscessus subsp. abscessus]SHZ80593.1 Uncharacterised protein [Mycobacteroides abscessus subsp. abscessus]SIC29143.1 Uncharacterised protein [Mycobacteroides abscessus subsp. abscessus]
MTSLIPGPAGHPDFRLDRPSALIAALPAMLGFIPEDSLVVVTLADGLIEAVLRRDLRDLDNPEHAAFEALAAVLGPGPADAVIAVVISPVLDELEAGDIIRRLAKHLEYHGVSLIAGHVVDRVGAHGWWQCYDGCGAGGPVDDPQCSPLTAAAVLAGRTVHRRREDLVALIAPTDTTRTAALAVSLRRPFQGPCDTAAADRRAVNRVMRTACRAAEFRPLSNREILAIARSLMALRVRDTLCALAVGALAADVERLWLALSRLLPPPWRAEALVLLGFSAYVRGDGPLAGVALDAALMAQADHRLGQLLMSALLSGMRPDEIGTLADTGYRIAHELGISLPPRQIRRAG